jgi:hypothetical protein
VRTKRFLAKLNKAGEKIQKIQKIQKNTKTKQTNKQTKKKNILECKDRIPLITVE